MSFKNKTARFCASCCFTLIMLALVGLGLQKVAEASCFIGYTSAQPTCAETNSLGAFDFTLETSYYSQGKGPWVMTLQPRNSISDGLVDGVTQVTPDSVLIFEGPFGTAADGVRVRCTGQLEDIDADGEFQLNAWDSTGFACSGAHSVTVKAVGDPCN